jgi:prepilin signal peptidase PulO-like enzyme (type II secretory pathway)
MNILHAKNSTGSMAGLTGLLFALVYVGLEFLHEIPKGISIYGDANTITVWHFPLIWLLASIFFYCVFHVVRIVRDGRIKDRAIPFSVSLALALLLALFWVYPMISSLMGCFGENGC